MYNILKCKCNNIKMSNSLIPIKVLTVDEPRLKLGNTRVWACIRGGQDVTYYQYPSTSFNNSGFNFITNPPSNTTVLDRLAILRTPVNITFTANSNTSNILQPGLDAFRSFPISSITNTLSCTLNGFPMPIELSEVVHALSRFHLDIDQKNEYISLLAQMDDNYQNYSDGIGCNNNPLGLYKDNSTQVPRGAYPYTVISNTPTSAEISAVLYEPVILPPFLWDGQQAGGLVGINTLQFNYILNQNPQHIWSHASTGSTIDDMQITFTQPSMMLGFVTPKLLQKIPPMVSYPYFQISKFITQYSRTLAPNTQDTYTSAVIQLSSIPRKLYMYLKQSNNITYSSLTNMIETTDTFLKINNISINWDNRQGVLSGADPSQLYQLSVLNGLKLPWVEFNGLTQEISSVPGQNTLVKGLTGSIICIELGRDIGLRDDQCEGLLDKINLQITVTATNINQTVTLRPDLYILAVSDGVLRITNGKAYAEIGVVTKEDILNADVSYKLNYNTLEKIYGGDFASAFKGFTQDIGNAFKEYGPKALNVVKNDIIPIVREVAPYLPLLGLGEDGGAFSGGESKTARSKTPKSKKSKTPYKSKRSKTPKPKKAGVLVGGEVISEAELKRRLRY
jgi:hypothetical protein